MRQFKIYNPAYKGEIEVLYDGVKLLRFDCSNAIDIAPETIASFKKALPARLHDFLNSPWSSNATKIVEADYEASFADFWAAYNKKINKIRAEKIYTGMGKLDKILALQGIKKYDAFLKEQKWRAKADPETYLRNKMWENEY